MTDRPYLFLMGILAASGVIYMLVTGLNIRQSDVTVYTRYTAFGEVHFYKDHWQYLLLFMVFGLVVAALHLAFMVKLHNLDRRQTGILVGWIGILLLLLAAVYTLSVMSLGRAA